MSTGTIDQRLNPLGALPIRRLPPGSVTSVFIVDDHAVVREGVRAILGPANDFVVVGEADNRADALRGIGTARPALALVDVRMPGGDGIEVVREVRSRGFPTACIMLTAFVDDTAFFQSVVAGAAGYLVKGCSPAELLHACRRVARGESLIDRSVLDGLRRQAAELPDDDVFLEDLTPQERRILNLVTDGLTNGEIADRLGLAEKTVRNYVSTLLGKMGMKNRTQAAAYVARSVARRNEARI